MLFSYLNLPQVPEELEQACLKNIDLIDNHEDLNRLNNLYKKYLTHYPKNLLKGLTGNSFPFEPGSIIVFDNRFIHCTSKLNGEKLGITFGFK